MKNGIILTFAAGALMTVSCGKCLDSGKACLILNLSSDSFFASTKALDESEYRDIGNYDVKIVNSVTGAAVLNCKSSELSSALPLELEMGAYDITASYGREHPASRDEFYVEGKASILLQPDQTLPITLNCKPTCGRLSATFDAEMDKYYSDYYIEYRGPFALENGSVRISKEETDPWYLKLAPGGEDVEYTLNAVARNGYKNATATGSFKLMRNKSHKLLIKPDYKPEDGSLNLTVSIDEGTDERNVDISIPASWL